jgi:hypothetical protein
LVNFNLILTRSIVTREVVNFHAHPSNEKPQRVPLNIHQPKI